MARTDLGPLEWRTLQLAPFWVLSALTGTYRGFDALDLAVFASALDAAAEAPGRLSADVIASVRADLDGVLRDYEADDRPIASGLGAVAEVLAHASVAEARLVKLMLVGTLGVGIARARGPYGRVATTEDMRKLRVVVQLLADTPVRPARAGAA